MNILQTHLEIFPQPPFNFELTATSHGWISLLPNFWDNKNKVMERIQKLSDGRVTRIIISGFDYVARPKIKIFVYHTIELTGQNKNEIKKIVGHMFRLDEDFSGLYRLSQKHKGHFLKMEQGFGRLLRSPSVFEDVVKTILTTNIQWAGTKRMVQELLHAFGKSWPADPLKKTFPDADDMVRYSFEEFISKTNLGYRAGYIYQLAKQVSSHELDLQSFLDPDIATKELRRKLLAIKGIGNYAAATLLMLLGHYDELPVDSVFKEFVFKKYFKGKNVPENSAVKIYKKWKQWKYLAYWFDMEQGY